MRRILIGYDGSERGDDALALGRALAAATAAEAVVATVYEQLSPKSEIGGERPAQARRRRAAEEIVAGARDRWPELDDSALVTVCANSASGGLHRFAEEHARDAIVVGSSHRSALGRVWPGSVTDRTLHGAPCAVAVAPPGYCATYQSTAPFARIGVGYDGSAEARRALDLAGSLAGAIDATVVAIDVVHGEGPPLTDAYGYASFLDGIREAADLHLADARARLRECGVARVETERPEGLPSRELTAAAERLDLLVLGSRGHGPAMRLLLGCSSSWVVRSAACPVLVLPRSATGEQPLEDEVAAPARM